MTKGTTKRTLTVIQIVLAVLVVAGLGWIAFKVVGYNQAQRVYQEMQKAYAAEPVDGDPSSIDFAQLQEMYPNVVGWLKMDDVDISYPIVKGEDNDYYLHYGADGQPNIDGSIFMDYRNKSFDDLHVLIYGHNMLDGSMFATLHQFRDAVFFFKQKTAYELMSGDWSSDVCSSDLPEKVTVSGVPYSMVSGEIGRAHV